MDRPCIAPADEADVHGNGFSPSASVLLGATGAFGHPRTDAEGHFDWSLRIGQSVSDRRPVVRRFVIVAHVNLPVDEVARTVEFVSSTAASVFPRQGRATRKVEWHLTGLAPGVAGLRAGRTIYAHWLYGHSVVASTRFGIAPGTVR